MSKKEDVLSFFNEILPNAGCELIYSTDYGFLISVMLSAQTTDKKVNQVTEVLFNKYPSLNDLANADIIDIENILKSKRFLSSKVLNEENKQRTICLLNEFLKKTVQKYFN